MSMRLMWEVTGLTKQGERNYMINVDLTEAGVNARLLPDELERRVDAGGVIRSDDGSILGYMTHWETDGQIMENLVGSLTGRPR